MSRYNAPARGAAVALALAMALASLSVGGCDRDNEDDQSAVTTAGSDVTLPTDSAVSTLDGGQTSSPSPPPSVDYEAVLPDLTKKAEDSPTDPVALQELAIAQYQTRRYAEAVATYESMLAVEDSAITHNNLANVLRDWGKIEGARAEYEEALALDPTLTIVYINLASLDLRQGDNAAALKVLDRGIAVAAGGAERGRLEELRATIEAASGG
jgi:tetratricopeptide (TPR) repeat protein